MKHDSQDRHERSPGNRAPLAFASGEPAMSEDEPILQPGTELGAYRICELIGEGGMGRVYLAEHARLGRKVALKLLRASATRDPKLVQRFFREARAVNQINHEHIVQITDFVEGEGGASYYIMELLKGQTLGARMLEQGALPLDRVLSIGIQTCEALSVPRGAEVFRVGDSEPLGLTPFSRSFDRASRAESFELRLPGHVSFRRQVSLDQDARVTVVFTPAGRVSGKRARQPRKRRRPARTKAAPKKNFRGTLDPFDEQTD